MAKVNRTNPFTVIALIAGGMITGGSAERPGSEKTAAETPFVRVWINNLDGVSEEGDQIARRMLFVRSALACHRRLKPSDADKDKRFPRNQAEEYMRMEYYGEQYDNSPLLGSVWTRRLPYAQIEYALDNNITVCSEKKTDAEDPDPIMARYDGTENMLVTKGALPAWQHDAVVIKALTAHAEQSKKAEKKARKMKLVANLKKVEGDFSIYPRRRNGISASGYKVVVTVPFRIDGQPKSEATNTVANNLNSAKPR